MGGYGCILHPAIVFRNSTFVTEENKDKYVTKISRDAESEFNFCEIASEILFPDANIIGIFPVENLHCGVSARDLGEIADEVYSKCDPIQDRTIVGRKKIYKYDREVPSRYISPISDHSPVDIDVLEGGRKRGRRCKGGTIKSDSYLCAIQYPKYDSDLRKYVKKVMRRPDFDDFERIDACEFIEMTLMDNIKRLHDDGILHLDIKMENIGVTELGEPKFADWDFACFELSNDSINDCFERTIQDNYYQYYRDITYDEFNMKTYIGNYRSQRRLNQPDPGKDEKFDFLKNVDLACLFSTLLDMWATFGVSSEVYINKKKNLLELYDLY